MPGLAPQVSQDDWYEYEGSLVRRAAERDLAGITMRDQAEQQIGVLEAEEDTRRAEEVRAPAVLAQARQQVAALAGSVPSEEEAPAAIDDVTNRRSATYREDSYSQPGEYGADQFQSNLPDFEALSEITGAPRPGPVEAFQRGVGRTVAETGRGLGKIGENLGALWGAIRGGRPANAAGATAQTLLGGLETLTAPLAVPGNIVAEALHGENAPDWLAEGAGLGFNFATQGGPQAVKALAGGVRQLPGAIGRGIASVSDDVAEALRNLPRFGEAIADEVEPALGAIAGRRFRTPAARTAGEIAQAAADEAANKRISQTIFALPPAVERSIEGQFYMGGGVTGERALRAALEAAGVPIPETLGFTLSSGQGSRAMTLPDLLHAAVGAPTRGEELGGRLGMLGGGAIGASTIEEGDDPRAMLGKVLTGAAAGTHAGLSAARLGRAAQRIHRAGLAAMGDDALGAVAAGAADLERRPWARPESVRPNVPAWLQGSREAMAPMLSGLDRANRAFGAYERGNLLLSPATHLKNVIGNTTALVLGPLEKLASVPVDMARAALTGGPRTRYLREVPAEVIGDAQALPQAFRSFVESFRESYPRAASVAGSLRRGQSVTAGRGARAAAEVLNPIKGAFAMLGATDEFFRAITRGGQVKALAQRYGSRPPDDEVEAIAAYRTFTQDDDVTRRLSALANLPVVGPLLFTFVKTPFNVAKYELERVFGPNIPTTVKGLVDSFRDPQNAAKAGEAADRAGRLLVGGLTSFLAYRAAETVTDDGRPLLTGSRPTNPAEAELWDRLGVQEFSILGPDGDYHSYSALTGVALPAAAAANLAEFNARRDKFPDAGEAFRVAAGFAEVLTHKPFADNAALFLDALMRPEENVGRLRSYAERTIASQVPGSSALRAKAASQDPYQREVDSLLNRVQMLLPGEQFGPLPGRESLPERLDAYGRPILNDRTGIESLSPFPRRRALPALGPDEELRRLAEARGRGVGPTRLGRNARIAGEQLTPEQRQAYRRESGQLVYDALLDLFDSGRYDEADDERKAELIRAAVSRARTRAGLEVLPREDRRRAG